MAPTASSVSIGSGSGRCGAGLIRRSWSGLFRRTAQSYPRTLSPATHPVPRTGSVPKPLIPGSILDADNPTHGVKLARRNTQDGQYDTDAYVTDLLQLADNWPLQRFAIIGHSMGGTNAINFAGALSRTGLSAPKPAQKNVPIQNLKFA